MTPDLAGQRDRMVRQQIVARGVHDALVLDAMQRVRRELFVPPDLVEFAYRDSALEIEQHQTISQPYIVAAMLEAAQLRRTDRVLEVGTGSGYAAAVLSVICDEVYSIERHASLAESARERLSVHGFDNVRVVHGDGTLGLPEHAPYDAILVAAGGPRVPDPLREQLAIGGRLVIPVGLDAETQVLLRVTRVDENTYDESVLQRVRFVPLVGAAGWEGPGTVGHSPVRSRTGGLASLLRTAGRPIYDIDRVDLRPLLERIGNARVVLLGEATHGTSEFYQMRARITKELVAQQGFDIVAIEADWPDAARIDHYVRHRRGPPPGEPAFTRFPTWMWRNAETEAFVEWLHEWNGGFRDPADRVGFHGLDLYSLHTSIAAVLRYLDDVDHEAAAVARRRYACLTPWERDPAVYGRLVLRGRLSDCEDSVTRTLTDLLSRRIEYAARDGERYLDATQNARLVASAERYYRTMYYGATESWNLRDQHMFDTLDMLLRERGPDARAVVWAHNSHVGNAAATEMGMRGEFNVGQLCREAFGDAARLVGFGTDHGTVAAADDWDAPMQVMQVRPAQPGSYERLFHETACPAMFLPVGDAAHEDVVNELSSPRLERAIGVVYRPASERESHYFEAELPSQFDEYVWFDETHAVRARAEQPLGREADTWPFGL